jgi:hypothetical protein
MNLNPHQRRMIEIYQEQVRRNRVNKSEIARAVGFHPSYVNKSIKAWRAEQSAPKGQLRECLCCDRVFVSEGKHDRLCDQCGHGDEYHPYTLSPAMHAGGY